MPAEDERVERRAGEVLPEETAAGAGPSEQMAAALLADSDARQADRDAAPGKFVEHRRSEEA